nr:alpha/beta hydrolase-fold protein [Galbitalea soli]
MPRSGRVSVVDIPGTVSHFHARPALVYLPPAALTAAPPPLPVLIALSGQPGQPSSVFRAGHLDALMNAYAATHHGLAPIVVAPDQLGSPYVNPMCVDGRLGNSRSYLTIDVPRWIRAHLSVLSGRRAWAIGGFSQGGTCSVQLAAGDPALFGSFVDVAGELVPSLGTVTKTIDGGFSRNAAAYRAATPRGLMLARAPYADTVAFFTVGQTDTLYTHRDRIVARIARSVGMHVTFLVSPGTGHDWSTVDYGFVHALPVLTARMGLP